MHVWDLLVAAHYKSRFPGDKVSIFVPFEAKGILEG